MNNLKILHLGDLHIGKKVNDFSMIEDQKYILNQILNIIEDHSVDIIIIAGDVYDKAIPTVEAIDLFNDFLLQLNQKNKTVLIISGNHDSNQRLNFASEILKQNNIYIVSKFNKEIFHLNINDIDFYCLPFFKHTYINHELGIDTKNMQECIQYLLSNLKLNHKHKNILVAHLFVTANQKDPDISDSETSSLGGLDKIDYQIFKQFDYVALGHIHKPQAMGSKNIRYCGSPLKYSLSEANINKSVTIIDTEKMQNYQVPLTPLHDLQILETNLANITSGKTLSTFPANNYYQIILTDEEEIIDAIGKVKNVYPLTMQLNFKKRLNLQANTTNINENDILHKSTLELFSQFFKQQNHSDLNQSQIDLLTKIIDGEED